MVASGVVCSGSREGTRVRRVHRVCWVHWVKQLNKEIADWLIG